MEPRDNSAAVTISPGDVIDLVDSLEEEEEVDRVNRWDQQIQNRICEELVGANEQQFNKFLQEYHRSLKEEAAGVERKVLVKEKLLNHIRSIYFCCSRLLSKRPYWTAYLDQFEDLLVEYCALEFGEVQSLIRTTGKRGDTYNKQKQLEAVCRHLCALLAVCLRNSEAHIMHVLIKMRCNIRSVACREIMNGIYSYFMTDLPPKDFTNEAFCRYYLTLSKWKQIRPQEEHHFMDKVMYYRLNRSEDCIKTNESIQNILGINRLDSVGIFSVLTGYNDMTRNAYFRYIKNQALKEFELENCLVIQSDEENKEPETVIIDDDDIVISDDEVQIVRVTTGDPINISDDEDNDKVASSAGTKGQEAPAADSAESASTSSKEATVEATVTSNEVVETAEKSTQENKEEASSSEQKPTEEATVASNKVVETAEESTQENEEPSSCEQKPMEEATVPSVVVETVEKLTQENKEEASSNEHKSTEEQVAVEVQESADTPDLLSQEIQNITSLTAETDEMQATPEIVSETNNTENSVPLVVVLDSSSEQNGPVATETEIAAEIPEASVCVEMRVEDTAEISNDIVAKSMLSADISEECEMEEQKVLAEVAVENTAFSGIPAENSIIPETDIAQQFVTETAATTDSFLQTQLCYGTVVINTSEDPQESSNNTELLIRIVVEPTPQKDIKDLSQTDDLEEAVSLAAVLSMSNPVCSKGPQSSIEQDAAIPVHPSVVSKAKSSSFTNGFSISQLIAIDDKPKGCSDDEKLPENPLVVPLDIEISNPNLYAVVNEEIVETSPKVSDGAARAAGLDEGSLHYDGTLNVYRIVKFGGNGGVHEMVNEVLNMEEAICDENVPNANVEDDGSSVQHFGGQENKVNLLREAEKSDVTPKHAETGLLPENPLQPKKVTNATQRVVQAVEKVFAGASQNNSVETERVPAYQNDPMPQEMETKRNVFFHEVQREERVPVSILKPTSKHSATNNGMTGRIAYTSRETIQIPLSQHTSFEEEMFNALSGPVNGFYEYQDGGLVGFDATRPVHENRNCFERAESKRKAEPEATPRRKRAKMSEEQNTYYVYPGQDYSSSQQRCRVHMASLDAYNVPVQDVKLKGSKKSLRVLVPEMSLTEMRAKIERAKRLRYKRAAERLKRSVSAQQVVESAKEKTPTSLIRERFNYIEEPQHPRLRRQESPRGRDTTSVHHIRSNSVLHGEQRGNHSAGVNRTPNSGRRRKKVNGEQVNGENMDALFDRLKNGTGSPPNSKGDKT